MSKSVPDKNFSWGPAISPSNVLTPHTAPHFSLVGTRAPVHLFMWYHILILWATHFVSVSPSSSYEPSHMKSALSSSVPLCCPAILYAINPEHRFINSVIHHRLPLLSHKTGGLCLLLQSPQFLKPFLIHSRLWMNVGGLRPSGHLGSWTL